LFPPAGRGECPFLEVSITNDGAEAQQELNEATNLYPPLCISLTEILLVFGLGAATVIGNIYFYMCKKTWKRNLRILL